MKKHKWATPKFRPGDRVLVRKWKSEGMGPEWGPDEFVGIVEQALAYMSPGAKSGDPDQYHSPPTYALISRDCRKSAWFEQCQLKLIERANWDMPQ